MTLSSIVGNTEAQIMKSEDIKALLARQVMEPVVFMIRLPLSKNFGVDEVIEIGPGKSLVRFLEEKLIKLFQLIRRRSG